MRRRILIFDDELIRYPDFLSELSEALGGDIELVYRAHADDAVDEVRKLQPVAVLMDYSMGPSHYSGAGAVSNLREHFNQAELPIVGISSDSIANQRMQMAGANTAVVKMAAPARLPALLGPLLKGTG